MFGFYTKKQVDAKIAERMDMQFDAFMDYVDKVEKELIAALDNFQVVIYNFVKDAIPEKKVKGVKKVKKAAQKKKSVK